MKKKYLKVDTIYRLKYDLGGLKLCVLQSNRNNSSKNKKMREGCTQVGMQSPGIFTDARLAMEAGYVLLDVVDGHTVTKAEVDDYLVIVDGNTRFHAWWSLRKDFERNGFEYKFTYIIYPNADSFKKAYNGMNVYNTPTSTADFARDLLATSPNPILISYRSKFDDGLYPKAAGYATIGREIGKKDLTELQKGNIPAIFNDHQNTEMYLKVYNAIKPLIGGSVKTFRGTEIWSWIANKINGADDKMSMANKLVTLFESYPAKQYENLKNAKAHGNQDKASVVKGLLDDEFNKLK